MYVQQKTKIFFDPVLGWVVEREKSLFRAFRAMRMREAADLCEKMKGSWKRENERGSDKEQTTSNSTQN